MFILKPYFRSQITVLLMAWLLPTIMFTEWWQMVVVAITLLLCMSIIKPILKLLFLPISIVTLGNFSVLLNTGLFWAATFVVPGFRILPIAVLGQAFGYLSSLVITSTVYSVLYWILGKLIR